MGTGEGFSSSGGAFAKQLIALYTTTLGNGTYWLIGIAMGDSTTRKALENIIASEDKTSPLTRWCRQYLEIA